MGRMKIKNSSATRVKEEHKNSCDGLNQNTKLNLDATRRMILGLDWPSSLTDTSAEQLKRENYKPQLWAPP